jgi:hypothetical protein
MKNNSPFKMAGPRIGAGVGAAFILWVEYFNNKGLGCPGQVIESNNIIHILSNGLGPHGECLINLAITGGEFGASNPFLFYLTTFTVGGFLLGWGIQSFLAKKR